MMISVVIPAYNEEERITSTVLALTQPSSEVGEVIVVDDCSRDDTLRKAQTAGATVIPMPRRAGKGAALMQGTLKSQGDIVVFLDADIGETAREIARLIEPIATCEADMTVARFPQLPNVRPRGLGIVKSTAYWGVRRLCKSELTSILSGQRAARRPTFLRLMPFAPGFGVEVGLTIDALRQGLRILEVDCEMAHRVTGWNLAGFSHRAHQFYWVAKAVAERCVN
ncbi:MAG: glycosyltransferase family 2 protein [Firmicutes bacterium]|nr:glycosyltransferase family 2 protein [Bacillota bacterium]